MGIPYSMFAKQPDLQQNGFVINFLEKNELSPEVRALLLQIKTANARAYAGLLQQLHAISDFTVDKEYRVYIQAHHFNTIVGLLSLQHALPPNILIHVNQYLSSTKPETTKIIQNLRKCLPYINSQARDNNLTHHSLDHGTELKVRVMQVITEDLGIYNTESDYDVFMRNILSFAFECHDYFQGKPTNGYATVEEQTAAHVIDLLCGENGFPNLSIEVLSWIRYQIVYMIPVATTVAFSTKNPIHLAKLLGYFEEACKKAEIPICHPSNTASCFIANVIAHIAGCFDTMAYVMLSAVKRQARSGYLATELYLRKLSGIVADAPLPMSLMKRIMISENMQPYFVGESEDDNLQALAMSLVSKLGMTVELANKKDDLTIKLKARLIGDFIREMKTLYSNTDNVGFVIAKFDELFDARGIDQVLDDIFFQDENITTESNFAISNIGRACLANKVVELYFKHNRKFTDFAFQYNSTQKKSDEIIVPRAVEADANNIKTFFEGYKKLTAADKKLVLKEFALNLVIQAGRNYLKNPTLEECLDGIPRRLPTGYNASHFAINTSTVVDDDEMNVVIPSFGQK